MFKAGSFPNQVHILEMHSHQLQGNIAVAFSEKAMIETYKECFRRERDTKAKRYFVGNVVDLPAEYVEAVRDLEWQSQMETFQSMIQMEVADYYLTHNELPPNIKPCDCFPKRRTKDKYDFFPYRKRKHKRCQGMMFLLADKHWDELFEKKYPDWDKDIPKPSETEVVGQIQIVLSGLGQRGVSIEPLANIKEFTKHPTSACLFSLAFVGEEKPVPAAIDEYFAEQNRMADEASKAKSQMWKAKHFEASVRDKMETYKLLGYSDAVLEAMYPKVVAMVKRQFRLDG